MRKMSVVCDVCGGSVEKFNGAVTLASWGSLHKDACSPKCLCALLRGFAADIEKREKLKAEDNIAFAAQHPEAMSVGSSIAAGAASLKPESVLLETDPKPAALTGTTQAQWDAARPPETSGSTGPMVTGCAACTAGIPFNDENDFRHTGEGERCKMPVKSEGPCACSPEHWKMEEPPEVVCTKCGRTWTAKIKAENMPAPTGARRGGRKPGSKNRPKEGAETTTNGTANGTATAPTNGVTANSSVAETPENKAARDVAMGRNYVTEPLDETERLKTQREQEATNAGALRGPGSVFSPLETPETPPVHSMENLSQLVTQAEKHGLHLSLIDVATWTTMQKDLLQSWLAHPEFDRPAFLESKVPAPPPAPPPPASEPTAKPRFTF